MRDRDLGIEDTLIMEPETSSFPGTYILGFQSGGVTVTLSA